MYNEELNNQWISKLREYVRDKRVLLLGNSLSLFSEPRGDFIDSFDVVIRVGKGFPYPEFRPFIGKKFDVWSFGVLRSGGFNLSVRAKFRIFNFLQIHFYNDNKLMVTPSVMFDDKFQVYKDFFLMGSWAELKSYTKFFQQHETFRLSQGLTTLLFMIEKVNSYKELNLFGFDFFDKHTTFNSNGEVKVAHSWHIPLAKPGLFNPHSYEHEKKFITKLRDKNLINLHPCSEKEVDKYVLNSLFKRFRPEGLKE